METVFNKLKETGARRVLDLGCGEGKLLRLLLSDKQFETILGMDVSRRTLETARERLKLDDLPERQRDRVELIQGSLTYRDQRLGGYDAAAVVEVIEHLDAPRLATFERNLFEIRPAPACDAKDQRPYRLEPTRDRLPVQVRGPRTAGMLSES